MSAPRRRKPRKTGLSRRDFLKRAGAGAAVLGALPLLPACDSSSPAGGGGGPGGGEVFRHGVASGDPLADRVVLWTRVSSAQTGPVEVGYVVARDPAMTQVVRSGSAQATAARDYTVKVDPTGLDPGTTYYYRFSALGQMSPVGRTRTLPTGSVERLRIAVVSCASYAHGLFNAYARVAARQDLDLVVHLGDYIYEYNSGTGADAYGDFRPYEPAKEILSLADYRQRYAQYRLDTDLQALHRQHPMVNIWDDHETADNSSRDAAVNHTPETEGDWAVRVAAGLQAFYEWLPVRQVDAADPRKNYRSFRFGDLAELVMLEERLLAREQPIEGLAEVSGVSVILVPVGEVQDENRQLLGAEQEAWLAQTLRATPARWKLLGQGVMFGQFKIAGLPELATGGVYINPDQWDGYPAARARVYDVIEGADGGAPVSDVVVLTGDIHSSWSMDLARDPNQPLSALGGYNPITGEGSRGVEFVATAITSPGLESFEPASSLIGVINPHIKYADFSQKGYLLLDVTPERVVGEHWYVDTITAPSTVEAVGGTYQTLSGSGRLSATEATTARSNPPPFAP
ncbi:MAG TPA: alkaline phosphatase D family protein [Solimonas sp.]|nr:alkaline phosphatase D family protein [Solimonas sp.]